MSDQLSHGVILDVIEQQAELTLEAMDYENFAPGKPFKSGTLTFPETANNRAALGTLYETDGAAKVRIIENVTYENEVTTLKGSLVISGQTNENGINSLNGFFLAGNGLLWLDFGDTKLTELDWSAYDHILNITNQQAGNALVKYDLTDRGKYIDTDAINMIERYPAFNIAEMLKVIFKDYDLQSNFITQAWFTPLYLLFTRSNEIRNDEDWKETALINVGKTAAQTIALTVTASPKEFTLSDTLITFNDVSDPHFDNGNNFASNVYTVPETGTYRFIFDASASMPLGTLPGDLSGTVKFNIYADAVKIAESTYTILNQPTNSISNLIVDSDYIELAAGAGVSCFVNIFGEYTGTMSSGDIVVSVTCTLVNKVSRYYGYGSTVDISKLMPDIKINDFLKIVFQHFAIMPQFSHETNIVRLNVWQRQQSIYDITTFVNPKSGQLEYFEAFDYDLKFAEDRSDSYAQFWYSRNINNTGDHKSNNGSNVKKLFQSAFSNTIMHGSYQVDNDRTAIPILWQDIPVGVTLNSFDNDAVPEWRTTFNYRIVQDAGVNIDYPVSHHTAGEGREVETLTCNVLTSAGIELSDLHDTLHAAMIARINNGSQLTIMAVLPVTYLNMIINNDSSTNLYTPVYIGLNPYVGMWTVRQIVTNGQVVQLTLILNDE